MNSFLNLSTNAIKTADSLIKHAKEETYDEVEDSIKSLRKNFKAGNYFAISTFLLFLVFQAFLHRFSMEISLFRQWYISQCLFFAYWHLVS